VARLPDERRCLKRAVLLAAGVTLLATCAAQSARADTSAQIRVLAAHAESDPVALAQLRTVTVVDGRQVDFAALLHTSGPALQGRLRALAVAGPTPATRPDAAAQAKHILSGRRFTGSAVPRPFHRMLAWLGGKLSFIDRFVRWLGRLVPGGVSVVWTILCAIVVGIAAAVALRIARRREGRVLTLEQHTRRRQLGDPGALDRAAAEAEERGEFELALRLRFRAGLIRLGRADRLPLRDSLTSGQAAELLHLEDFDALARDFDEVVYGRRPPGREDVVRAREEWARVLARAGNP
jgi:Domain of unknown function (DUF4129)